MYYNHHIKNEIHLILILLSIFVFSHCEENTSNKIDKSDDTLHCVGSKNDIPNQNEKVVVKFLITSDPQYDSLFMFPERGITLWADSISGILKKRIFEENFRGVLLAGDLTHNGRLSEVEKYKEFISGYEEYIYDGLGNHDYRRLNGEAINKQESIDFGIDQIIGPDFPGWDTGSIQSWKIIRDRKRETKTNNSYPNIHYSWDWEDIHFIQLNLFAGNEPAPDKPNHNPFFALDYLINDLETNLKKPNAPVVIIQHYGFDTFSLTLDENGNPLYKGEWWTTEQREAFWDVIKDRNIIAVFAGHAHNCKDCQTCYIPWDGNNVGIDNVQSKHINSFISGSAREGMYTTCAIYDDVMHVERWNYDSIVFDYILPIKR